MSTSTRRSPMGSATRVTISLGCATLLLFGCGGGGGVEPIEPAIDFPVAAAVASYAGSAHQYDLAGALDGVSFTMRYTYTPDVAGNFEGRATATAIETLVMYANGTFATQTASRRFFTANPYVEYGSVDDDGSYSVFNQTAMLPTTARVTQSGVVGSTIDYADSSKTQITATGTVGWSLDPDTVTTALLCLNQSFSGTVSGSGAECYRINATGQVLGMLIKVDVNGKTLTLK